MALSLRTPRLLLREAHWTEHGFGLWALELPGEAKLIHEIVAFTIPANQRYGESWNGLG